MPVVSGIGSSLATLDKQEGLRYILDQHLEITARAMENDKKSAKPWIDPTYIYIDAYCGNGLPCPEYPDLDPSPKIFLHSIKKYLKKDSDSILNKFSIWFIDKNKKNIKSLKNEIPECQSIHIVHENCVTYVPYIADHFVKKNNSFGILYLDPNNTPDLGMLQKASSLMKRVDFLIRMNCTSGKRNDIRITDIRDATEKDVWMIR